jgi:hypothetical protein
MLGAGCRSGALGSELGLGLAMAIHACLRSGSGGPWCETVCSSGATRVAGGSDRSGI